MSPTFHIAVLDDLGSVTPEELRQARRSRVEKILRAITTPAAEDTRMDADLQTALRLFVTELTLVIREVRDELVEMRAERERLSGRGQRSAAKVGPVDTYQETVAERAREREEQGQEPSLS